ncbi:P27 family phage terminase small subunit [Adlercreutzia shanghongiae]|uniref:P27 family phage terminase small subunit n=1 Tax=Adlercreutzia shanghongiae TaxID=3111773 RepID=A0ABU6IW30_9ACTN|nr:P27 family phage terminase small subunit [Adlercreutzia sp. R22]MEC4294036.1 P27 family phage terminase small subunit [Adlercreutzia sp. R22]
MAEERRGVSMPAEVAADLVQSEIWALIAPPVNNFTDADIPNLKLLVYWHALAAQVQQDMAGDYGTIRALEKIGEKGGEDGEPPVPITRKHPGVSVLKTCSTEIRALSDQLGLSPLARSRIGLMDAVTTKTAADTAAMFRSIDAAYAKLLPEAEVVEVEDV